MRARLTETGRAELFMTAVCMLARPVSTAELRSYERQIEASVDRALTPTAEIRQHINGTCWCRYITIPEEYVEWVG